VTLRRFALIFMIGGRLLDPAQASEPPIAQRVEKPILLHSDSFSDPYDWMRDATGKEASPDKKAALKTYIDLENAYAESAFQPLVTQISAFASQNSKGANNGPKLTFLFRRGGKDYFISDAGTTSAPAFLARMDDGLSVSLNIGPASADQEAVQMVDISSNGRRAALLINIGGGYRQRLRIVDTSSGQATGKDIDWFEGSAVWTPDGKGLYFLAADPIPETASYYQAFRLKHWTSDGTITTLAKVNTDDGILLSRTSDGLYAVLREGNLTDQKVSIIDLRGSARHPKPLVKTLGGRYHVDHSADGFAILSTAKNRSGTIYSSKTIAPRSRWRKLYQPETGQEIESIAAVKNRLALQIRGKGLPQLALLSPSTGRLERIAFDHPAYKADLLGDQDNGNGTLQFSYESMTEPKRIIRQDLTMGERDILGSAEPAPPGWVSEYLLAPAKDGTMIPILLIRHEKTLRNGKAPLILYGYGAHGNSQDARFGLRMLDVPAIVASGGMFAIAQVRGGGEQGHDWYLAGTGVNRQRSIDDFIASTEFLQDQKYSSPAHMAAAGNSSGGTLVGAAANLRPDLYRAIYLGVPSVDLITDRLFFGDTDTQSMVDLGDVTKADDYRRIAAIDPYRNLPSDRFPAALVETAQNDTNVPYWHSIKYMARLRAKVVNPDESVLRVFKTGGHAGPSDPAERVRQNAERTAWLLSKIAPATGRPK
jgi:oligopeptidase B